jgi:hypothetical protein
MAATTSAHRPEIRAIATMLWKMARLQGLIFYEINLTLFEN